MTDTVTVSRVVLENLIRAAEEAIGAAKYALKQAPAPLPAAVSPPVPTANQPPQNDRSVEQLATYKGKQYRLLFVGDTKYGRRAQLAFKDGSKEFWVDAAAIETGTKPVAARLNGQAEIEF